MPRILRDLAAMADALGAVRAGTAWRREPLARNVAHARRLGIDLAADPDPDEVDDALERHIGSVDLLDADVVPSPDDAAGTRIQFRYEKNAVGRITSDFSRIPLTGTTRKVLLGQPVNIIQHPTAGHGRSPFATTGSQHRGRQAARVRDGHRIGGLRRPCLQRPVGGVALHYTSVDATDEQGRAIDRNGDPVTRDTPEHLRNRVANAGIWVSAIILDVEGRTYDAERQPLVDELLERRTEP